MWTKKYKQLSKRCKRFINNFIISKSNDYGIDKANWKMDCKMYGYDDLANDYDKILKMYSNSGCLSE